MTLGFSNQINGKPTYFIEKIWHCLYQNGFGDREYGKYLFDHQMKFAKDFDFKSDMNPKIHTIRQDPKDRWKVGNKIHFVTGNRTKNRFQFAPVLKVKRVQKIRILQCEGNPCVYLWAGDEVGFMPFAYKGYNEGALKALAINDGFESIQAFFDYFNEDFEGKIIHWTNTIYHF